MEIPDGDAGQRKEYGHNWKVDNADKVRAYAREHYAKNRESILEKARLAYKRNKDKNYAATRSKAKARYLKLKDEVVKTLGGKCAACGATECLEIDHVDPHTKTIEVTSLIGHSTPEELAAELRKCQLLCEPCHMAKTIAERGHKPAKGTHGTLSSYRYCKCELCTAAHSKYCLEWKARKADAKRKRLERRANEA